VYLRIAERLDSLLEDEKTHQQLLLRRIREITGSATPDEVVRAVEGFLADLKEHNIPQNLGELPMKGPGMRNTLQYLDTTAEEPNQGALAVRLSAGSRYMQQALELADYLDRIAELARRVGEQQSRQIEQLQSASATLGAEQRALELYDEILALLREPTAVEENLEVQP
jgi:rubrerythrin